uniref:Uncharacterized protein n=1 Tax=Caenorhabditis japonica TaxID=281687 RepID=A0A8R1ER80_CAEJA
MEMERSAMSRKTMRGVCSRHLRWNSMKKFQTRLMKEGKLDEYTTEEVWNFQL